MPKTTRLGSDVVKLYPFKLSGSFLGHPMTPPGNVQYSTLLGGISNEQEFTSFTVLIAKGIFLSFCLF